MKKYASALLALLLTLAALCGAALGEGQATVHEDVSVQCIRAMMALDYPDMTVHAFAQAVEDICAAGGTSVFAAITDAYDHYAVYDGAGEFLGHHFGDPALEAFMDTTLSYTAQEMFGEPVHVGSAMRLTLPGMTATELADKRAGMTPQEWAAFFDEHIEAIQVFPIVTYAIEALAADAQSLTVAGRDARVNAVHAAIRAYVLGMDDETARAQDLQALVEAELSRLSAEYSDGQITITCQLLGLEREGELWT